MTKEELYGGKKEKTRICEVLGVDVDEEFTTKSSGYTYRINASGRREIKRDDGFWSRTDVEAKLADLINYPETIIRKPHWTAEDIEDAKAVKRLFPKIVSVSRNAEGTVSLTDTAHLLWMNWKESERFASLKPGRTATIDEILEEGKNNDR